MRVLLSRLLLAFSALFARNNCNLTMTHRKSHNLTKKINSTLYNSQAPLVVSVGEGGLVVLSEDAGTTWRVLTIQVGDDDDALEVPVGGGVGDAPASWDELVVQRHV
jgi:hypothetical protein